MIGLDREAAKRAFDGFLAGKTLNANQIHFINLVIDYLTQAGWMSAAQLYESPFTDFSPRGVEGVFDSPQVTQLLSVLDSIRQTLRGHIKSGQRWSLQNRPTKVAWD
jgi:type I restriction enzyme R subunit